MATSVISEYLKFANLQMAAEANFTNGFAGPLSKPTLTEGNNRSSRFTSVLADEFIADWDVVEHKADTNTGFSGTLFRANKDDPSLGVKAGELVLSFRSTEFVDDAARDNEATNALEVRPFGWAFGQISDMKDWFDQLNADPTKLQGKRFAVTGYSLGGHLATAFNRLMVEAGQGARIEATYTFNAAGVGEIKTGTLTNAINVFRAARTTGNSGFFTDASVRDLYVSIRASMGAAAPTRPQIDSALSQVISAQVSARGLAPGAQKIIKLAELDYLYQALDRARDVYAEAARVKGGISSGNNSDPAKPVDQSEIDAVKLDYQIGVLRAKDLTRSFQSGIIDSAAAAVAAGRHPVPLPGASPIYDIYGAALPSAVANSQHHYGEPVPIFIEDQPLVRGSIVQDVVLNLYQGVKLLEPGFSKSDFGDIHSLVLLVDSLKVQDVLAALDGNVTPATLASVLHTASNREAGAINFIDDQGKADGDTLEKAVKELADLLRVSARVDWLAMKPSLFGGTWANLDDVGGSTGRNTFYSNIKTLITSDAYRNIVGKATVAGYSSSLNSAARTDFGSLASLLTLSSLVISGTDSSFATAMQSAWGTTYTDWMADKALTVTERSGGAEVFTQKYFDDRNALLASLVLQNRRNTDTSVMLDPSVPSDRYYEFNYFETTRLDKAPPRLEILLAESRANSGRSPEKIFFGGDANDVVDGYGNAVGDHLYGGEGQDILNGQGGNDYLEGNADADKLYGGAGNDTLLGGAGDDSVIEGGAGSDSLMGGAGDDNLDGGTESDVLYGGTGADRLDGGTGNDFLYGGIGDDTYVFAAGWGIDTIEDDGGQGTIQVAGVGTLTGLNATKEADGKWTSADGRVDFTVVPASGANKLEIKVKGIDGAINVANWSSGDLGITLGGTVTPPATNGFFEGDFDKQANGGNYVISNGNYVSAGLMPSADDEITGSATADLILGMLGNDALAGMDGNDDIEGGDGDDLILGGLGADIINGGAGSDVIFGSGVGGLVLPSSVNTPPPTADGPEITRGFSWVTYDSGIDANGFDVLMVRGADARTWLGDDGNVIDGGAGDDWLYAGSGNDIVHGGADNDNIEGLAGEDTLFGDAGNDDIQGDGLAFPGYIDTVPAPEQADDILVGGAGNDTLAGQGGDDELYGGDDDDLLFGDDTNPLVTPWANHGSDYLDGGAGKDQLVGGGKDDALFGGTGNDELFGDASIARLDGQYHGNDYLDGEDDDDYLEGGGGTDTLYGGSGKDMLWGDASDPGLSAAQYGEDYLDGEAGNDTLDGGGKGDTLFGGDGDDALSGDGDGPQVAAADHGDDYLDGGAGDDYLRGDGKSDTLIGGDGKDYLVGDGDSVAAADEGDDFLDAGAGDDTLLGNGGNDYLDAGTGNDNLYGGTGDDYLDGGAGDDYLEGNAGNDTLVGGAGTDILRGGAGDDTYIISAGDSPLSALGWSEAIVDNEGRNVVVFDGMGSAGVQVVADANGTVQVVAGYGQSVVIQNGVSGSIESYRFGDGRSFTIAELVGGFSDSPGSDNDSQGRRHVLGGRRNESLGASGGNSVLSGGRGNDTLTGSGGNNTYRFSRGDGSDLLVDTSAKTNGAGDATPNQVLFGAGIVRSDVRLTGALGALRIQVGADPGDSITLGSFDQASALAAAPIDAFVFDDGSSVSYADLVAQGFQANDGGDSVSGSAGDDSIAGGNGDDVLAARPATTRCKAAPATIR